MRYEPYRMARNEELSAIVYRRLIAAIDWVELLTTEVMGCISVDDKIALVKACFGPLMLFKVYLFPFFSTRTRNIKKFLVHCKDGYCHGKRYTLSMQLCLRSAEYCERLQWCLVEAFSQKIILVNALAILIMDSWTVSWMQIFSGYGPQFFIFSGIGSTIPKNKIDRRRNYLPIGYHSFESKYSLNKIF